MPPANQGAVIVYGADRRWRLECDAELRAHGMRPRLASRPAEVVKCLRDAVAPLLVVDGQLPPGVDVPVAELVVREGDEAGSATIQRLASRLVSRTALLREER